MSFTCIKNIDNEDICDKITVNSKTVVMGLMSNDTVFLNKARLATRIEND